ncbi:MAG: LysR family transcriptional regulator [Actinobacteria bacterium]|nr:LysR family transcriptional regulator [Actinomycetota bacterium]
MHDPSANWQGLELRHLATLVAIAEEESFAKAAARLGYTSSAVSQQISGLERIVGERLLERASGRRAVSLTPAGELLVGHAEGALGHLVAARTELLQRARHEEREPLTVGVYQSVGARLVPSVLLRLARTNPQLEVRLREGQTDDELVRLVREGSIDATFAVLPVEEGPYETIEVLRDPYLLMVRADSPLARAGHPPTVGELSALDFIGFQSSRSVRCVEDQFRAAGLDARTVRRCADVGTLQGLVAAGLGVALVPRLLVDARDERLAFVPLGDGLATRRVIALTWHRDRASSAAVQALARAVAASARTLDLAGAPGVGSRDFS